ncbi:DUF4230 domain-containing protein [bacterium]|nr:MAG: DUF4230 domain-containing protein [bacterium]
MKARLGLVLAVLLAGGWLAWRSHRASLVESRLSVRDFVAGINAVQPDLKLVVAKVELVKAMSGESAKSVLGFDLGTTKASLTVPARVHYAVDLTAPDPVAFRYDRPSRVLVAEFPEPAVQAVEVLFQDKRFVVEPGWGRLKERSGKALEEAMERGVYASVKKDAEAPAALSAVREKARPVLARFLEGYLQRAGLLRVEGGVEAVSVRFKDEPAPALGRRQD